MMRGCKGMKSTSFQLPSSSTFCVGSLHFLCFDVKADAIPADRGPHSKEGSIISIASLIRHHFSRKLDAWKPHEDAYLLVLDVIVQLKSEQTMNRLQAATGKDHIKNTNLTGKSCAMVIVWCIEYDVHQTLLTWFEFVRDSWAGWSWPETHCWSLRLPLSPFGQFVQLRSTFIPCLHVPVAHDLTCAAGFRRSSWAVLWLHEHSELLGTETVKKTRAATSCRVTHWQGMAGMPSPNTCGDPATSGHGSIYTVSEFCAAMRFSWWFCEIRVSMSQLNMWYDLSISLLFKGYRPCRRPQNQQG